MFNNLYKTLFALSIAAIIAIFAAPSQTQAYTVTIFDYNAGKSVTFTPSDVNCGNGSCILPQGCDYTTGCYNNFIATQICPTPRCEIVNCPGDGQKQCANANSYKICKRLSNTCTIWTDAMSCGAGNVCSNGECVPQTCTNQCTSGYTQCFGNSVQTCSDYNGDGCTEWGNAQACAWGQTCSGNSCTTACTNDCTFNDHQCSGSSGKTCLKNSNGCTYWGNYRSCDSRCHSCGDQRCDSECGETRSSCARDCGSDNPTVNLTSSGTATCGQRVTLSWTSANAVSCNATNGWSGSKSTSGSEIIGNFSGTKTFTITCYNSNGNSAIDNITIASSGNAPIVSAGSDREIDNNGSVILNGSIENDAYNTTYSWNCTGGTLSDYNVLRPTFYAPPYVYSSYSSWNQSYNHSYTCTLTAHNDCGSDSDSVNIRVSEDNIQDLNVTLASNPNSGCAPLNDVDLTASLSNYSYYGSNGYNPNYTYYFDCQNDGIWEKTITTGNTSYTAYDLCDYNQNGTYTTRVRVENGGRVATDTHTITVNNCDGQINALILEKWVANLSNGSAYQTAVNASPSDVISYKINVRSVSSSQSHVIINDIIPNNLNNIRDLQIDGNPVNGSISSIDLGNLTSGQTKTITFTATIAPITNFAYGQTALTNTVTTAGDNSSNSARATVYVYRTEIKGATTISTGFGDNIFTDSLIIPLGLIILGAWFYRSKLLKPFAKRSKAIDPNNMLLKKIAYVKGNNLVH